MQRLRTVWAAALILAMAASLVVVARGAAMVEATTDDHSAAAAAAIDDARAIRELAGRAMGAGAHGEVTFYPGRVGPFPAAAPDGRAPAPVAFPLPAGGRLIGSVARRSSDAGYGGDSLEVIGDAPGTPAAVFAFYQATLAADGWRALGLGPEPYGGGPAGLEPDDLRFAAYCRAAAPSWLSLTITGDGRVTDVHLQSAHSSAPCAELP